MRWPYIFSLLFLLGAGLFTFFNILNGASTGSLLGKWYWLEADTSGIPGAHELTRWTSYGSCGVQNNQNYACTPSSPGYPLDPYRNFGTLDNVPSGFSSSRGDIYYLTKVGWAFLLIGLVFILIALIPTLIAFCLPSVSSIAATTAAMTPLALLFSLVAASLLTAGYCKGRDHFRDAGRNSSMNTTQFAFLWTTPVLLILSSIINGFGCRGGLKKKERYTEHYGGEESSHETYGNNYVHEKVEEEPTRRGWFGRKKSTNPGYALDTEVYPNDGIDTGTNQNIGTNTSTPATTGYTRPVPARDISLLNKSATLGPTEAENHDTNKDITAKKYAPSDALNSSTAPYPENSTMSKGVYVGDTINPTNLTNTVYDSEIQDTNYLESSVDVLGFSGDISKLTSVRDSSNMTGNSIATGSEFNEIDFAYSCADHGYGATKAGANADKTNKDHNQYENKSTVLPVGMQNKYMNMDTYGNHNIGYETGVPDNSSVIAAQVASGARTEIFPVTKGPASSVKDTYKGIDVSYDDRNDNTTTQGYEPTEYYVEKTKDDFGKHKKDRMKGSFEDSSMNTYKTGETMEDSSKTAIMSAGDIPTEKTSSTTDDYVSLNNPNTISSIDAHVTSQSSGSFGRRRRSNIDAYSSSSSAAKGRVLSDAEALRRLSSSENAGKILTNQTNESTNFSSGDQQDKVSLVKEYPSYENDVLKPNLDLSRNKNPIIEGLSGKTKLTNSQGIIVQPGTFGDNYHFKNVDKSHKINNSDFMADIPRSFKPYSSKDIQPRNMIDSSQKKDYNEEKKSKKV